MFVAAVHVSLDLEPEVPTGDRERLLRSLRDRLKQHFSGKLVVRTDDECSFVIALVDDHYERIFNRSFEVIERIENCGEARISTHHVQVFEWFDGEFQEVADTKLGGTGERFAESKNRRIPDLTTYVYDHEDSVLHGQAAPLDSRLNRKSLRLPIRKP